MAVPLKTHPFLYMLPYQIFPILGETLLDYVGGPKILGTSGACPVGMRGMADLTETRRLE